MRKNRSLSLNDIDTYVEGHIGAFHEKRLESLQTLKLDRIIRRKNPYLFRAKNILTAQDFVKILLDAHLSSQEETIFGNFLGGLSIYICGRIFGGSESSAEGIDLEFKKDGRRHIVAIKSGPNWGNSSQIRKMREDFKRAIKIVRTNSPGANIIAINGCCYGRDGKPEKGDYLKLCGQKYWEFISGDAELYTKIIEPLGHKAREKNEKFLKSYSKMINKFTFSFIRDFCKDGRIDWETVVRFNSSSAKL